MKMTRASYTNNCAVTYEPSREQTVYGVSDQVQHKPSSTAKVDGYMLAIYFFSVINNLRFIKPLYEGSFTFEKVLRMHVQRMLEMSRCLYTGVNFKQNLGEKSIEN